MAMPGAGESFLENLHVRLFAAHWIPLGPSWKGPFYNSFWRLYVNTSAGGRIWTHASEKIEMAPHRVYIVPAWVRFEGYGKKGIEHCYAHFEVLGLPATLIRAVFNKPCELQRERPLDACVAGWTAAITGIMEGGALSLELMIRSKSLVYLALARMIGGLSEAERERCVQHLVGRQAMTPALEYIEAHLAEPIDNEILSDVCHVSRDHLIRLFRKQIGQTPAQFILERRVSQAAQQLIFSAASIEQIAEQNGFLDRFHFSRTFKARMGVPPATYRKTTPRS